MTKLKACPFCGSGETRIDERKTWQGPHYSILGYRLQHWCEKDGTGYSAYIERPARTEQEIYDWWNTRTPEELHD